jgi:alpha-tubulin suppressor-like RCC1 family protein
MTLVRRPPVPSVVLALSLVLASCAPDSGLNVEGLPALGWRAVAVGDHHSCAVYDSGALETTYCWGADQLGELGSDGEATAPCGPGPFAAWSCRAQPLPVVMPTDVFFQSLDAGPGVTCALANDRRVFCWGSDERGALGNGAAGSRAVPTPLSDTLLAQGVTVGAGFACAILADTTAACWGANEHAQLGAGAAGDDSPVPVRVAGSHKFYALSAGAGHACGITGALVIMCWGDNGSGQLGVQGGKAPEPVLVPLP